MACRCSEISRCERDIALLRNDIAKKFNDAQINIDRTLSAATSISRSFSDAVFTNDPDRISQHFATVKKQHDGFIDNLQAKRYSELQKADILLKRYKSEDSSHHEVKKNNI